MRGELHRAVTLFRTGRTRKAVIIELAGVFAAVPALWIVACAFVLMEPLP